MNGIEHNQPILSICIPTYNRGTILDNTLKSYISDPGFDNTIEIVISDNASTDNTYEVGRKYSQEYQNIRYYRNEENIKDLNFSRVLELGKGVYLKLMNDTACFKKGSLSLLKDKIILNVEDKKTIFFYQNIPFLYSNCSKEISGLTEFISSVSFFNTWILNFGVWLEDFQKLNDKNKYAAFMLVQTDWTFNILINEPRTKIYFGDFYITKDPLKKGGYNLFRVFSINYLFLCEKFVDQRLLSKKVFQTEKYRLFRYFLLGWYNTLVLNKSTKYSFNTNNAFRILFSNYKYNLYFYCGLCYLYMKKILSILK